MKARTPIDAAALRRTLAGQMPPYMVPARIAVIGSSRAARRAG